MRPTCYFSPASIGIVSPGRIVPGGLCPTGVTGRVRLSACRCCRRSTGVSRSVRKISRSETSSLSLPLMSSTRPFYHGEPGSV